MERKSGISFVTRAAIVAGAGAMVLGACDNDSSKPRELELPAEAVSDICDPESRIAIDEYIGTIGTGPYDNNEAMRAEVTVEEDIRTKHAKDLLGNVPGIALLAAQLDAQGSASYSPASVVTEAIDDAEVLFVNDEEYVAACESVVGEIKASSEFGPLTFTDGVRITNQYSSDSKGFNTYNVEPISGQTEEEGVYVRDANDQIRYIINDKGEWIFPKTVGTESGNDEAGQGVDQNAGNEEGQEDQNQGQTGGGADTGTNQGDTDEGDQTGGGGADGGKAEGEDTGQETGPGTSMPGVVDNDPGGDGGDPDKDVNKPSHSSPGTTEGPGTTAPGTTTTTQPPTTTTTTTQPPTTTTTTQPPTTTTTTQPPTTTEPEQPTTTEKKGAEPGDPNSTSTTNPSTPTTEPKPDWAR